jgi:predicted N-acetyltransferase YhbS
MEIRAARPAELLILQDIERAAGQPFRDIGMPEVAQYEPLTLDTLARAQRADRLWVVAEAAGEPVAYLLAEPVDGNLHIEQVSVHPQVARRRLGRRLIDHAAQVAVSTGMPALTLTTFRDVPWNAPYYERCGFRTLDPSDLTPGLRAVRAHEAAIGLDRWPRVCMRRDLADQLLA